VRIALISDLHANLPALDAVLTAAGRAGVDRVVCLGDVVDLGPQPNEVVARLRALGIACARGNHDTLDEHPPAPFLADIEAWTAEVLEPDHKAWLDALPEELEIEAEGRVLWGVHGVPGSLTTGLLDTTPGAELAAWAAGRRFDVLAAGHTHVQLLRRQGERAFVNVGSVGSPFEAPVSAAPPRLLPWAEWACVDLRADGVDIALRRTAYDVGAAHRAAIVVDMPHALRWAAHWVG
jgi:putative phosphoesterase